MSDDIDVTPEKVAAVEARLREMAARLGVAGCLVALEGADTLRALSARLAEVEAERGKLDILVSYHHDQNLKAENRAEAAEAKLGAAYIAGLEAMAKAADCGCEGGECVAAEFGAPMCYRDGAAEIETLKDPAHVRAAVAKLTEGGE